MFVETGDANWVTRLPMVKSAVKAMDAATEFLASAEGGKVTIKKFVVAGGSKRGWTTWLTGAADPRVKAIAEMDGPVLGFFNNHFRGDAVHNARTISELLQLPKPPWSARLD